MKLIDNVNNKLGDDLKETVQAGSKLSIAAASFSIYAFEELKEELQIGCAMMCCTIPTSLARMVTPTGCH